MSPWNFPIAMIFNPIANALAAGNRVMIKPSEFNPRTAAVIEDLVKKYFKASPTSGKPWVRRFKLSIPVSRQVPREM
ncbi:MAG: aldehyde dehydrogenase family protein [Thalassobaculaceae bacterium]